MKKQSKRGLTVSITMLVVVIIISMAAAGAWAMFYVGAGNSAAIDNDIFAVKKGGFEIVVPTSGELAALRQIEIKNRLETRATITEIIEEGEHVKKGALLISFNDEDIRNKIKDADDALDSAINSLENAKANLEIRKKTRESELARAELEITLTELAWQAWKEGEDVTRRQDLALELKTAQMEYDRLQVYFEASKRLFEQEFISLDEYTRNEIALVRAESNLKQANLDIDVYEKYEYLQDREKKESDRKQAVDEQDRTKQRYDAEVRSAESDVRSAERLLESRQERFDKWTTQLELCVILAPSDGLVVYASSLSSGGMHRGSNEDPPMVGTDVARNRTVIVLPDTSQMIAEVKVNEALSGMIKPGQRATVVSDALPDTVLSGEVMSVGVLAQTGGWRDPNRRDYTVKILLDDFALSLGLKPSMRCRADIKVGRVDDTLYIPIQSVFRQGPVAYAWIPDGRGYSQTEISIGQASELYVEITGGLNEGQVVLMREPEAKEVASRLEIPETGPNYGNAPPLNRSMTESSSPPEQHVEAQAAPEGERPERSRMGRGGGRPTAEQIQEMMKNATPEQRAAWEKRAAERRNRGGDRRSDGESEEKAGEVSPDGT